MPSYEAVIGLEVHVQLNTRTKMFCGCANRYGDAPNTNTCPVCLGLPGALPVPNAEAVEKTLLAGLMLGCDITPLSKFDRKNYFYPDMPKNYQLSQYDLPFCRGGGVTLGKYAFPKEAQDTPGASAHTSIRLNRIHLEEDVAKSTHHAAHSSIDFNRAGTPLMEIVTEAGLRTADQAYAFLKSLQQILVYGDVSDADMEKGQMRCDVNISVRPAGQSAFGTKCEIKNMNSISGVRRALLHEIARQIDTVASGGTITQETRRWNDLRGETTVLRTKEDAHDYRYFPCPDLLPVRTDSGLLDAARRRLPELPDAKKQRFQSTLALSGYQAEILASDRRLADYFERAAAPTPAKAAVANFLINDFLASEPDLANLRIPPEHFGTLAALVDSGQINTKQAKDVLAELFATGNDPAAIVREKGLAQMSDTTQLERLCDEAIAANPRSIEDYRKGKAAAINALKGRVMKETRGQANPRIVDGILFKKLGPPGTRSLRSTQRP